MEAEFLPKAKGFRTYAATIFLHFLMNRNLVIGPSSFTWKVIIRVDIAGEICAESLDDRSFPTTIGLPPRD
jgi:hypothetical protein